MRALRTALLAFTLLAAPPASAARIAVGVDRGASLSEVAARVARATGSRVSTDSGLRAVFVDSRAVHRLARLRGVSYAERLDRTARRLAFTPNDPLAARQWYLFKSNAFLFWPQLPTTLPGVKIAIVDSGIDGKHPEFAHRIAYARSFVGGSALVDHQGHGTFVAGEIAAATGNGVGIAGIAFPAQLVVAKVVRSDRTIPLEAEAKAIRWAADKGARVINLSLSGVRDPLNPDRDTYSPLEASAVAYASAKGALVVAAVGNGDQAPRMPWDYAGWPAALPHVLGVSAYAGDGSIPAFSDRDDFYNDLAAPGQDILSTFPRPLTAERPGCLDQGYSDCGSIEYRRAEGTSFAAPQVAAAAGLLLSVQPALQPDQVSYLLTRTANDATRLSGCRDCGPGRDALSGWGRLDILGALMQLTYSKVQLPLPDRYETNDDAGQQAWRLYGQAPRTVDATLDYWDDPVDVYSLMLRRGQKLDATLRGPFGTRTKLVLWKPGTKEVGGLKVPTTRARASVRVGSVEHLRTYTAASSGWYYLEVKMQSGGSTGAGPYTLSFSKT